MCGRISHVMRGGPGKSHGQAARLLFVQIIGRQKERLHEARDGMETPGVLKHSRRIRTHDTHAHIRANM